MACYRTYQCLSCERKFRYLHHPSDEPPPANCPLCGASTDGASAVFDPVAPAIRGTIGIAADQVYRAMEASSASRAEEMAALAGGSASDYSHTKITDLNDRQREGDTAYKMPQNEVRRFMEQHPGAAGVSSPNFALEKAAAAHSGYFPHAGIRTGEVVRNVHWNMAREMQRRGNLERPGS